MQVSAVDFHHFPDLPAELREEIWRLCLPFRVCELTAPVDDIVFYTRGGMDGPWPCELQKTTYINARPPLISRVCHESRSVAFKAGHIEPDGGSHRLQGIEWGSWLDTHMPWRDYSRDSAHLNWSCSCEGMYQFRGNSLHFLAWEASHLTHGTSLMLNFFGRSFYPNEYIDDTRDVEQLKQLPSLHVVMQVVVVHSDRKTAAGTGLFGLLGDASVQIVDASNDAELEVLFNLAAQCERQNPGAVTQDLSRASADTVEQKLRAVVMERYHSEELAKKIRPAIMIRLCTLMCNNRGYAHSRPGSLWDPTVTQAERRDQMQRARGRGRG